MTSSCTAPACIVEWGINDQYVIQWGILPRTIYCFVAHCFCNMCLILAILFKVVACFDVTKYILIASEIPEVARSHILSCTGWQWFYCDFFWLKKNKPASWCGSLWFTLRDFISYHSPNTRSMMTGMEMIPASMAFLWGLPVTTMQNVDVYVVINLGSLLNK